MFVQIYVLFQLFVHMAKQLRTIFNIPRSSLMQHFVRNVSLTAVQELVASLPNLKLLDCSFCDQLGEQGVCQLRAQVA